MSTSLPELLAVLIDVRNLKFVTKEAKLEGFRLMHQNLLGKELIHSPRFEVGHTTQRNLCNEFESKLEPEYLFGNVANLSLTTKRLEVVLAPRL